MSQEMNDFELPADLQALERQLAGITPAPANVDRDQIMYQAGKATAGRVARTRLRLWQGACGFLVIACIGMGVATQFHSPAPDMAVNHTVVTPSQHTPARQIVSAPLGAGASPTVARVATPPLNRVNPFSIEARISWVATRMGTGSGGGGGGKTVPTLRPTDGLDALPAWQQKALSTTGNRS